MHTIRICELLLASMPPLVPKQLQEDMRYAVDGLKERADATSAEVEETLIVFGKQIWPYRQAFQEFLDRYEGRLGEKFLLGNLPLAMKRRYAAFHAYGGTYVDLHSGAAAPFFSPEERMILCDALVRVAQDMDRYARQMICGQDRAAYERRVVEFQEILDAIEQRLDSLRQLADDEQEHPELAGEIRAQVRAFEEGLCLLHTAPSYDAICRAQEHFCGRKEEVYRRRKPAISH